MALRPTDLRVVAFGVVGALFGPNAPVELKRRANRARRRARDRRAGLADDPAKVVHLLWRLSEAGGVQRVVRLLAQHIDTSQVDLHVVTARPATADDHIDDLPVSFHSLQVELDRVIDTRERLRVAARVAARIRGIDPAVIHVHSGIAWMGFIASALRPRVPFVFEVHDAPGSGRHGAITDRIEGWWVRFRRPTILVHSTSVEAEVRERWGVPSSRIRRIPLAVNIEARAHAAPRLADQPFTFIAVGRMVPAKRFELALESLATLRSGGVEARLTLVGDGPELPALGERARGLGVLDAVDILGRVEDDRLVELLADADVLVSTSEYEGFGLTLVEAMMLGTPTVAMAVGGVVDVVDDGVSGYLVPSGDVGALAGRLHQLATDPKLLERLGRDARTRAVEQFSIDVFAREMERLYADVLGRPVRESCGREGRSVADVRR